MRTSSLITLIKKQASNWDRDNIRELLDQIHYLMMCNDLDFNYVLDETTGLPYKFTTTAETYVYDINTDNVSSLRVDWYMDLPNDVGLVSTPLVVDGVPGLIS